MSELKKQDAILAWDVIKGEFESEKYGKQKFDLDGYGYSSFDEENFRIKVAMRGEDGKPRYYMLITGKLDLKVDAVHEFTVRGPAQVTLAFDNSQAEYGKGTLTLQRNGGYPKGEFKCSVEGLLSAKGTFDCINTPLKK